MKQTKTMTEKKTTNPTFLYKPLHSKEFGPVGVVTNVEEAEGFINFDDLCRILDLQKQEVQPKLAGHLYNVTVTGLENQCREMPFVDEDGLYMLYLVSKKDDAIRFQDWLNDEFLQGLHDQQKANIGLGKNDNLVVEFDQARQALRYMATADNVAKSGHFRVGKDIPELTMSHLRGWWHNPNDKSTFMLQFNCQCSCYIYQNLRMNVYLMKQDDDNDEIYDMRICVLDLDDDNLEILSFDTWIPEYAASDNTILDYILQELTLDEDYLEPENIDTMVLLNSFVSFHRSRREMRREAHPLIDFE